MTLGPKFCNTNFWTELMLSLNSSYQRFRFKQRVCNSLLKGSHNNSNKYLKSIKHPKITYWNHWKAKLQHPKMFDRCGKRQIKTFFFFVIFRLRLSWGFGRWCGWKLFSFSFFLTSFYWYLQRILAFIQSYLFTINKIQHEVLVWVLASSWILQLWFGSC